MMYGSLTLVIEKAGLQKNCSDYPTIECSVIAFYNILDSADFLNYPQKATEIITPSVIFKLGGSLS